MRFCYHIKRINKHHNLQVNRHPESLPNPTAPLGEGLEFSQSTDQVPKNVFLLMDKVQTKNILILSKPKAQ